METLQHSCWNVCKSAWKLHRTFVCFVPFLRAQEPSHRNVSIKEDGTPIFTFLWLGRNLTSVSTFFQIAKLFPVLKIPEISFSSVQSQLANAEHNPFYQVNLGQICVTNGAVGSSYMKTGYCLSWKYVCNGFALLNYIKWWDFFLSLQSLSGLPVMCITFWFNAFSIKLFSLSTTFIEKFS